jgi:hypothetical protein
LKFQDRKAFVEPDALKTQGFRQSGRASSQEQVGFGLKAIRKVSQNLGADLTPPALNFPDTRNCDAFGVFRLTFGLSLGSILRPLFYSIWGLLHGNLLCWNIPIPESPG